MTDVSLISMLPEVLYSLQQSPDTPWYLVALVQAVIDLSQEVNEMRILCQSQQISLQEQAKSLDQLQTKYSEVLYHLKTVKE